MQHRRSNSCFYGCFDVSSKCAKYNGVPHGWSFNGLANLARESCFPCNDVDELGDLGRWLNHLVKSLPQQVNNFHCDTQTDEMTSRCLVCGTIGFTNRGKLAKNIFQFFVAVSFQFHTAFFHWPATGKKHQGGKSRTTMDGGKREVHTFDLECPVHPSDH